MEIENLDLKALISQAWLSALGQSTSAEDSSERAKFWIGCLARVFQLSCRQGNLRVFWRENDCNRSEFGLNELLFDISVCQVEQVGSIRQGRPLAYISKNLWLVESELNDKSSREITKDFSKLIMGSSVNKLFVSSYQGDLQEKVLEMCREMARFCEGNLFLCFIEHPRKWSNLSALPKLYKWEQTSWRLMNSDV